MRWVVAAWLAVSAAGCKPFFREPMTAEVRLNATANDGYEMSSVILNLPPTDKRCDRVDEARLDVMIGDEQASLNVVGDLELRQGGCTERLRYATRYPASIASGAVPISFTQEKLGIAWDMTVVVPETRTHLTTADRPVVLHPGEATTFTLPKTPDGDMHRARIGPIGSPPKYGTSRKLDVEVFGTSAKVTVPSDVEPGPYALLLRVDVPADIEGCPFGACEAWAAARFFAHLDVE